MNTILLSVDYTHSIMVTVVIVAISTVIGILVVWLSNATTGGRGVLYKFIQDYGYEMRGLMMLWRSVLRRY